MWLLEPHTGPKFRMGLGALGRWEDVWALEEGTASGIPASVSLPLPVVLCGGPDALPQLSLSLTSLFFHLPLKPHRGSNSEAIH